jgi:hypothetical protein
MEEPGISTASSAGAAPDEVRRCAEDIARRMGCRVRLSRERSGYHLYCPCPACLATHGTRELEDPKYTVNLSKLLGLGEHRLNSFDPRRIARAQSRSEGRGVGICMRTRSSRRPHMFTLDELKNTRVSEIVSGWSGGSGVDDSSGAADRESHWEPDPATGELCPPPPGETVPLDRLPFDHPAVAYCLRRGLDPGRLAAQFGAAFCTREYEHGRTGVVYRRMPGGWRDPPSRRIVFFAYDRGVPRTWQARLVERATETERFMLHPYTGEWDLVAVRSGPGAPWMPVPPFDALGPNGRPRFGPSKYRTAKYSDRFPMGMDAALERARDDPDPLKWCVVVEGPLDAAKVGPGGIAGLGGAPGPEAAARIAGEFHIVLTGFDNDRTGGEATARFRDMLTAETERRGAVVQTVVPLEFPGHDLGDLTRDAAAKVVEAGLRLAKRQM